MIYVRDLNGGFLTERKNIYICWVHEQDWVRLHLTHLRWKKSTWYIRAFLILLIYRQENISIVTKRKYCHHCMHWIWSMEYFRSCPVFCMSCKSHDSWWKRRHFSISFGHTRLLKFQEDICYWRVFHLACHIIHNKGQPPKSRLYLHIGESLCSLLMDVQTWWNLSLGTQRLLSLISNRLESLFFPFFVFQGIYIHK